ncbi:MAG: class I SAM-dependent methyltransferase [Lachnospiraceae bacterium]|nr:class I SAM-dependent methyltransferase [Lachnospiraceae bacterium]
MNEKTKVQVQGVPETMLQTLYARAQESKKPNHHIYDERAIEVVSRLDYDFSKAESDKAMSLGVIARTIVLDKLVGDFLSHYPHAVVLNIACGMDTRCYRMEGTYDRWYNIDLPETMSPFVVKHIKEKSIEKSEAKFAWGVKNGAALEQVLPHFKNKRDVSLVEGMKVLMPIYKVLGKIPAVRNFSNKICVMEKK